MYANQNSIRTHSANVDIEYILAIYHVRDLSCTLKKVRNSMNTARALIQRNNGRLQVGKTTLAKIEGWNWEIMLRLSFSSAEDLSLYSTRCLFLFKQILPIFKHVFSTSLQRPLQRYKFIIQKRRYLQDRCVMKKLRETSKCEKMTKQKQNLFRVRKFPRRLLGWDKQDLMKRK